MRTLILVMGLMLMAACPLQYEKEEPFVQQDCSEVPSHYSDHVTMSYMVDYGCR